jgi:hypothetical protein
MTSNITPITAASNEGDTTTASEPERPRHGLAALREREARELISLAMDALHEAGNLGHDMHSVLWGEDATSSYPQLEAKLTEAVTCLETAEHYLFMLGSVFEEHANRNRPPQAVPD